MRDSGVARSAHQLVRRAAGVSLVVAAAVGVAACAGTPSPVATVTKTVTAPTPSVTIGPSIMPSATLSTDSPSPTLTVDPSSTSVLPPPTPGRPLTLSNFFQPDSYWQENRYNIADKTQVQGIATTVDTCSATQGRVLELRLSNGFKMLNFSVGQSNNSLGSDQNLTIEVIANNAQIDIRHVPFNQLQQLTENVTSVNALQLRFYLDTQVTRCGQHSIVGVLTNVLLS